ncbi:hamartin isoform X3 [Atheta coriaria]|uniref:hamartin isoform X3 n=1 Tax=Dalotia coriaria TaxID=877792 RepID=UPI0031F3643F
MAEWFEELNSNDPGIVEEAKQRFSEQFSAVKEPWLVNGLYDHYMKTNSVRVLEILINVPESHHDYLFNKLHDSLVRGATNSKFQALNLLGHVVRKHPTWLFKITEKALFRELLKLLKTENDILLLLSALLLLIVLLPCIPSQMGPHLQDVFDIFSRLAAFNSSIPEKMNEEQLVHMQVGLYALLQRLYGMYPCNFLAYLRSYYKNKEASNIFKHTIKPMLQTVQMHPLLVTSTKDYELSTERWKEMTAHDVVVECEQYSIGLKDRFAHDACWAGGGSSFRSRSGTTNSASLESYSLLKNMQCNVENETFSPSLMLNYIQTPPAMGNETPTSAIPVAQFIHQHQINDGTSAPITQIPPPSPLRLIPSEPISTQTKRTESPLSQEDEEVQAIIVKKNQSTKPHAPLRQCDSVLQDHEHNPDCEQGSPCTSGGLHMPNSRQMTAFKNNMKRLRHHSQCGQEADPINDSTGSSPGSKEIVITNVTVRRANSCPDMKKNTSTATAKDGVAKTLEEKDEEAPEINGFEQQDAKKKICTTNVLTQTELPYEYLFLSIFPAYESNDIKPSPAPSPAPFFQVEKFNYASTYDVLDKYIDCAFQYQADGRDTVKSLKEQLQLVQQQLMFERARRETHATKNRTLFTDVTKIKVLEEHNSALTDLVKLLEHDNFNLKQKIDKDNQDKHSRIQVQIDKVNYWESKYKSLTNDFIAASERIEDLKEQLNIERSKLHDINTKWQKSESTLLNAEAEAKVYREQVLAGERGRVELERVNRELLLAGETIIKYRERFAELSARNVSDFERTQYTEIYQHELKSLRNQLELKATTLEAYRVRIADLDAAMQQHEKLIRAHKKLLNDTKEECNEKFKAIESKYQSQLSINRALEGKILEMYQQEITSRQGLHSPDTSSCHEVNASTERTTGLSPHSSPLSASLTSSEGSMAFMHSDMKNLQAIVDQKEPNAMKSSATENDLSMEACLNSSPATQMASTSKHTD